jgi:hypothetical protein
MRMHVQKRASCLNIFLKRLHQNAKSGYGKNGDRNSTRRRLPISTGHPGFRLCLIFAVTVLAQITLVQWGTLFAQTVPPLDEHSSAIPELPNPWSPLFVQEDSHVVVMEYEAWFGPNAVTFQNSAAKPILQSEDMQSIGGGYDSADPAVIRQHAAWMEYMRMDAALVDLTNNVSCIFNSEWFVEKYLQNSNNCPALRSNYQTIRDNTGNLYPAWTSLGTRLKLVPLLGGIDQDVLYKDQDGKTSFEKEVEYFGALMHQNPNLEVIYQGKPLMLIYLGAAQDPVPSDNPLWFQIRQFLNAHPEIADRYTFRMMAGYLDSQSDLWSDQTTPDRPVKIDPEFGFWSWVDRLNPSCTLALCPYYPSYNKAGSRVENFTASIATAGQTGWGCPNPNELPYCPDDALRYGSRDTYETFDSFMTYARKLDPIFLILHQFNEFNSPDEGWDADTNDDIEPANQWGSNSLEVVRAQILRYRHERGSAHRPETDDAP